MLGAKSQCLESGRPLISKVDDHLCHHGLCLLARPGGGGGGWGSWAVGVEEDRKINQMKSTGMKRGQRLWGKGKTDQEQRQGDASVCRASCISYPLQLIVRLSQIKMRIY